jgi:hypothetical protein
MASCTVQNVEYGCGHGPNSESNSMYCVAGASTTYLGQCSHTTPQEVQYTATPGSACFACSSSSTVHAASSTLQVATTKMDTVVRTSATSLGASTNSSASNPSTPTGSNSNIPVKPGISSGSAAGIGIGGVIIGALIASIALLVIFRRKRASAQIHHHQQVYLDRDRPGFAPVVAAPVHRGPVSSVDRLLPQPVEDNDLVGGISRIRDGIKDHVQNHYHDAPVPAVAVNDADLSELAAASQLSVASLKELLLGPASRLSTIRLVLAHLILARCVPRADGKPSFLPIEVSILAGYPSTSCKCVRGTT